MQEKLEAERQKRRQLRDSTLKQSNGNAPRSSVAPTKPISEYIETGNAKTRFFTTISPDMIEETLIEYLATNSIEYTHKKDKYQVDFTYFVQGNGFGELVTNDVKLKGRGDPEGPDEESKAMPAKDVPETENQVVKMRMKIASVPADNAGLCQGESRGITERSGLLC